MDIFNTQFIRYFNEIQSQVYRTAIDRGWWEVDRNEGELIALMHSELSEALEGLRKPHNDEHCPEFQSIEIELADCIIRIMDLAEVKGYRVAEALIAKAAYNETRDHKHGGKKF